MTTKPKLLADPFCDTLKDIYFAEKKSTRLSRNG